MMNEPEPEAVPVDVCFASTGMTCLCDKCRKPEPPPDMSDFRMETIRDPGNSGLPFILVMVVALIIIMLLVMK